MKETAAAVPCRDEPLPCHRFSGDAGGVPAPLSLTPYVHRFVNPVLRHLAGIGAFVELEHVGRRSGVRHRTPLMAFRHGDEMTIALTYGPDVQWLKNVRAAGGGRMHWRRRLLELGPPRLLTGREGADRMPEPLRTVVRATGIWEHFVVLPVLVDQPFATVGSPQR